MTRKAAASPIDMPRRSRSKGRHGVGSSSLSALKPMKQMWVSASTPPTSAVGVTPARTRSAPSAMDAAPAAQAMTTVSFGPVSPSRPPARRALEPGVGERLARGGQREPVGARAPPRDPEGGHDLRGHLGRDARAEALGVDQGDGLDRAGAGGEAGPEALDARAVGAHDAE